MKIDLPGIQARLVKLPVPAGNYSSLAVNDKALFWLSTPAGEKKSSLMGLTIANEDIEAKTIVPGIHDYELSENGNRILIIKAEETGGFSGPAITGLYIIDAAVATADLAKKEIDFSGWNLSVIPREEWRWMFIDAWRIERATISTTATCTASIGRRCAPSMSRWWIA